MINVCYVYEVHNLTNCVRASVYNCQKDENLIIVTCQPCNNGVYLWKHDWNKPYKIWMNGRLKCYEIPFEELEYIKPLDKLNGIELRKTVHKMQTDWLTGKVTNHPAHKNQHPDWLIPVQPV